MSRAEISQAKRKRIFDRDKGLCQMCGKELTMNLIMHDDGTTGIVPKNFYTIDHIKPYSKGGNNSDDNLRLLCKTCNCSKHNREAEDYIKMLDKKVFDSFEHKYKDLILKDYVKLGEKETLINGLQEIKDKFIKEIENHINMINKLEG